MIPAKGPAYLRRVSCGYAERSPRHFALWLDLFSSSKHVASNWLVCILLLLLCDWAEEKGFLPAIRSQRLYSAFLTFLCPVFSRPLLTAPKSPSMEDPCSSLFMLMTLSIGVTNWSFIYLRTTRIFSVPIKTSNRSSTQWTF